MVVKNCIVFNASYDLSSTYLHEGFRVIASNSRRGNQSSESFVTHNSIIFSAFFNIHLYKNNRNCYLKCVLKTVLIKLTKNQQFFPHQNNK